MNTKVIIMDQVNKTLYIPLYGKALVSQKGIIIKDQKAEEIWSNQQFPLKGKSKSKWLAYYMAMRSRVFDDWLIDKLKNRNNMVVLHLGCGMDSRYHRIASTVEWYDIDFPSVINERKKYYQETFNYHMLGYDLREKAFLKEIPAGSSAIVIMEGVSMYLKPSELQTLLQSLIDYFEDIQLLMDVYTEFAAKASKYKNPINDVGVTQVYGLNDPKLIPISFVREVEMTPDYCINQLKGLEKTIFKSVFAGKFAKKMYHLYEFKQSR